MDFAPGSSRLVWIVGLLAWGGIGAAVRFSGLVPAPMAKYGGDAVWAEAWMLGILALWPSLSIRRAAAGALTICGVIELFQLTGVPADLAPHGFVFRLFLGSAFGWWDLVAYAVGIGLTTPAASLIVRRSRVRRGIPSV